MTSDPDHIRAMLVEQRQRQHDAQDAVQPSATEAATASKRLRDTVTTFREWLYLDDVAPLYALAATLVANRASGDPVWLLLVAPPSSGKTELLQAAARLPFVVSAAKVTEASLLSGTSKKERAADATGGLLVQIGDFGVLLCKDFTSVLAQNANARAEAMAALREIYDGSWHRPVGTDGGKVLKWHGKCGLIGGVTPAIDQYGQVLAALGDRFVMLRLSEANVDAFGVAALQHRDREQQMRNALSAALTAVVEQADVRRVNRTLDSSEKRRLVQLADYTARARTAVVRDHHHDLVFMPLVEGPSRLVKVYARLLGGLEALGCEEPAAWGLLTRIAIDGVPALRTAVIRALVARDVPLRVAEIAMAANVSTKTVSRVLEDLSILKMAALSERGPADNSPGLWVASDWLRQTWPARESETAIYPPSNHPTEVSGIGYPAEGSPGRGVGCGPTLMEGEERQATTPATTGGDDVL